MIRCFLIAVFVLALSLDAHAGLPSKAVKEGAEQVMRAFGREAVEEFGQNAPQVVARRMASLGAKYGDDVVVQASQKLGPRVFRLVEQVGEDGAPKALTLMARQGDEAVWIISRPSSFALFAKFGDDAADAMIRHRGIADGLIENYGSSMARALARVDGKNGVRLGILADEGTLTKVPQRDAVLDTIGRYGNSAADWVWRHKGAITVASVAAAFVANPEPFINGAVQVVDIGGEKVIRPVAETAAKSINWNLIALIAVGLGVMALLVFKVLRVLKVQITKWLASATVVKSAPPNPKPPQL